MSRVLSVFHVESGCLVVTFFPLEGEVDLCRGHDPDGSIDGLFVCLGSGS